MLYSCVSFVENIKGRSGTYSGPIEFPTSLGVHLTQVLHRVVLELHELVLDVGVLAEELEEGGGQDVLDVTFEMGPGQLQGKWIFPFALFLLQIPN